MTVWLNLVKKSSIRTRTNNITLLFKTSYYKYYSFSNNSRKTNKRN